VGEIMKLDYAKLEGLLDEFPLLCFIMEEADIYYGSYSFRKTDEASAVSQNFVSVGRNYRMHGFLISVTSQDEIAPSLRRRTRKIYGKLVSKGDLQAAKRAGVTVDLTRLPRYNFHYQGRTQRIPDSCSTVPVDYIIKKPVHTARRAFPDTPIKIM
jgi:hypothetical protein